MVKTYAVNCNDAWLNTEGDDISGSYVKYEDYAELERRLLAAEAQPVQVPEWTNEQCLEFLSIAFRHAEIKGDLELDDIRLGVKMVNNSRSAMLKGDE